MIARASAGYGRKMSIATNVQGRTFCRCRHRGRGRALPQCTSLGRHRSCPREEDAYRVRVGMYRIVYEVIDERLLVHVVRVGHRRDVYEH